MAASFQLVRIRVPIKALSASDGICPLRFAIPRLPPGAFIGAGAPPHTKPVSSKPAALARELGPPRGAWSRIPSLARRACMGVDRVLIPAAASAIIGDVGRRQLYDQRRCYEAGRVKAGHTAMQNPPDWWSFELELSGHILDRMLDRGFSEADLRLMFETASLMRAGRLDGRWIVETTHQRESWEIVVEPDYADRVIVVVTAYRRGVK